MSELTQVFLIILSIVIVLVLESFKKPKLEFSIGDFGEIKQNDPFGRIPSKWTHVFVSNKPMPKILSWIWDRSPALGCRGWITFHDLDGQDLFGRKMTIRWVNNPEPLSLSSVDPKTGAPIGSIDWDKMRVGHLWDIPPGPLEHKDYGSLDVVFRSADDENCYGWNNDAYLHNWKNPEWKLGQGRYLAKIVIKTGGQIFTETVQVMNQGRFEDFRLEPSSRKL